ncbi:hypothetical protein DNTS_021617 [Danionella cerebrum]|uniref:JmjN domain-containing protein n=1 Tax=Danionella cerebrum TaxID=2873325 RepID=A0A553QXP2_9TELE|nr:hypothetical protein DNTS_021617 [Danionella translucida]
MSRERPKRNIIQKKFDDNDGIPWSEERVVRRVLYLSLKEFKTAQKTKVENSTGIINGTFAKRRLSGSGAKAALFSGSCKSERTQQAVQSKRRSHEFSIDGPSRKRPRLQAQRKFAQSHPCSPSATPLKVLEGRSPSPAALLTRRKPKTEDFLTFLCLRGSPALPSNMVYFGSAKGDEDVEEEEEEEEEEDNASDPSASCQSTPRKSKGANKCIANGHVFNGQTRPAEEPESRLRLRGKEPVLQRKERHSSSSARSSSTHNLRPNRTLQEQKSQASRMNGSSGSSTVSSRKTTEVQTPPTKAVKYPKGHVTYTKARLLKEAKLSLSTHTHTPPRHPHSQNSGKAQTSHAKMQKQVLPSAAAGRLYGTSVLPPRRNGLRQSKRQLELAGLSQTAAEVEVKRAKGQAVPLEARRRRAAQEVLARQQMPGSQRPKRASAGKLMFTKQMQCKAKNSPTTSTRDPPRSANLPKTSERKSSAPKQSSAPPRTELLSAEPKERGRRSAEITEVPVFYPTTHEFHDPLSFVELVRGQSEAFGLFRVVPPAGWSPECKLKEEMRFVSYVQHVHKLGRRWGPNVQRLACIRRHLRAQGLNLDEPPLIGNI